ncbi:hypothetical protein HDU93_005608, partial [Gonapodya sp. JEL0774]
MQESTLLSANAAPRGAFPVAPPKRDVIDYSQSHREIMQKLRDLHNDREAPDYAAVWIAATMRGSIGHLHNVPIIQDSGAALSAISASFYRQHFGSMQLDPWNMNPITVGNGQLLAPLGRVLLPVTVAGVTKALRVAVIENLPHSVLLGVDFLRIWRAVVDYDEGWIACKDSNNQLGDRTRIRIQTGTVQRPWTDLVLSEPTTIPSYTAILCDVQYLVPKRQSHGDFFVKPHPATSVKLGVLCAQGVVKVTRGRTKVLLSNLTANPLKLLKGTPVATAEPHMSSQFNLMTLAERTEDNTPSPIKPPRKSLQEIRKEINQESINTPYVPKTPIEGLDLAKTADLSMQEQNYLSR